MERSTHLPAYGCGESGKVKSRPKVFIEESFYMFLNEVESVINNQLLTPTSDSMSSFEALTPNVFVVGTIATNYELGIFNDRNINNLKKCRAV